MDTATEREAVSGGAAEGLSGVDGLPPLAEAKLAAPRPQTATVERPRLLRVLDAGEGTALTLVSAAARLRQDDRGARLVRQPRDGARLGHARRRRQRSRAALDVREHRGRPGAQRPRTWCAPTPACARDRNRGRHRRAGERDRDLRRRGRGRSGRPARRDGQGVPCVDRLLHRPPPAELAARRRHTRRPGAQAGPAARRRHSCRAPRRRARVHAVGDARARRRARTGRAGGGGGRGAAQPHRGLVGSARSRRALAAYGRRPGAGGPGVRRGPALRRGVPERRGARLARRRPPRVPPAGIGARPVHGRTVRCRAGAHRLGGAPGRARALQPARHPARARGLVSRPSTFRRVRRRSSSPRWSRSRRSRSTGGRLHGSAGRACPSRPQSTRSPRATTSSSPSSSSGTPRLHQDGRCADAPALGEGVARRRVLEHPELRSRGRPPRRCRAVGPRAAVVPPARASRADEHPDRSRRT